jgi:putrescine transport system substrate-binding protein
MFQDTYWQTRTRGKARHGIVAAALALLTACGGGQEQAASPESGSERDALHVYNFADYIGESTIRDFATRTGIKVTYDVYDSNELLSTKLLTGNSGYDVVFPSGWYIRRDLPAGVFLKLDKSKLSNLAKLDPAIMRFAETYDPGNQHAIVYLWGTTGIGYNPDMVEKALGTRTIDSWAAVFDPAVASRLAGCGIAMLDSGGDMLSLAKLHLGLDMNSQAPADLAAAKAVLMGVRPYVRYLDSSRYISDLATGEICIAVGWVNGVHQARTRGAQAATPVAVSYAIPKEGAPVWFDFVAIPIDTPNPDQAHAFLNYLMEPEVIAAVTNVVGQPNGNAAALRFVDKSIRDDPNLYPTTDVMQRLHTYAPYSDAYVRQMNRAWTQIQSGQ